MDTQGQRRSAERHTIGAQAKTPVVVVGFRAPAGFTTITILILGSLSINAMLLGVLGEYLGRMYMQMKKKSLSIVERVLHDEI